MLPTHMLCWQYENWLRRLLLGLVAIESAAAYGIEKCLGLVGKTEERCAFSFFLHRFSSDWYICEAVDFVYVKQEAAAAHI